MIQTIHRPGAPLRAQDPRLSRCKIAKIPLDKIIWLMTMNGEFGVEMTGWPKGAKVIGAKIESQPPYTSNLVMVLYHPEFPLVLDGKPETIKITAKRV